MNILVCIKQILDPDVPILIDKSKRWIETENHAAFRMNHFDEFALEEALKIREISPGARVDVLSVGPRGIEPTLRRALGMGADEGIHILLENEHGYLSPYETAFFIASWARDKDYHLILTGVMSEDTMHGQVGQMVAEIMGVPCVTSTIFEKLSKNSIYVEREIEGGVKEAFELSLPALLTIQTGINRPRYPALSHVLRAKDQSLITVPAETLLSTHPREHIAGVFFSEPSPKGIFLQGSPEEKALQLLHVFHERALI